MKHTEKELEKYLFTEEEIKRQMEEEKYFYDRTITKYKDIKSYNECDDDEYAKKEYIKKIGNKYVFFYGEEKCEEFETIKEVEDCLCGVKASELWRINRQLSLLDDNYFYARVSMLYKNLLKKVDSSEISLELEEWIKKWIKDSIDFRHDFFARIIIPHETEIVGNYLYIKIKDDNHGGIYDDMYARIDINTLEKGIVKEVDYSDFVITKDIK